MKFIPMTESAGITGFESPASDYLQLPLSLDALLVDHPSATFIGKADGQSMQGVGIFSGVVNQYILRCRCFCNVFIPEWEDRLITNGEIGSHSFQSHEEVINIWLNKNNKCKLSYAAVCPKPFY